MAGLVLFRQFYLFLSLKVYCSMATYLCQTQKIRPGNLVLLAIQRLLLIAMLLVDYWLAQYTYRT